MSPTPRRRHAQLHKAFSPVVKDAISHLEKASKAVFNQHVYFALSPDMFNPFNLLEIERSFSSFALRTNQLEPWSLLNMSLTWTP